MRHTTLGALLLLVFLSGAASALVFAHAALARGHGEVPSRGEILDAWMREVDLTAEQRSQFERICEENHARFAAARARVEPELAAIRSDVRARMRAVLGEEQRPRFDEYCARRDRERARCTR